MSIAQQVGHCKVSQGRKIKSLRKVSLTRRGVQGILCAAFMPIVGHAANLYWDGTNTNNPLIGWNDITSWSTVNNATTPDPLAIPGLLDDVFFNINTVNAAQIVDLNGNQSALGLTFNSTGTVLIQGGTNNAASILTLGSDGMLFNPGAGVATFSAGIVLGAAQLWNNNSSVQVQGKTANAIYTQNFANLTLNAGQSFLFASRSSGDRCNFNFTGTFTRAIGGPLDIPTFDVTRNVVGSAAGVAGKFLSNGAAYVTLNGFTDWGGKPTAAAGNIQPVTYTSATTNVLAGNANFVAGVTNTTLALDTTITTLRDAVNQATVIDLGTHILTTGGVLMTSTVSNVAGSTFDMTDNGIGIFNLFQGATFNPAGLTIGGAALPAPIFKLELGDSATGADQLIVSRNAVLGSNGATINILPLAGDTSLTPGNYTSRLQH